VEIRASGSLPARERGSKHRCPIHAARRSHVAPRAGARIETPTSGTCKQPGTSSAPRAGARIETAAPDVRSDRLMRRVELPVHAKPADQGVAEQCSGWG
jgi:hypothetical protein